MGSRTLLFDGTQGNLTISVDLLGGIGPVTEAGSLWLSAEAWLQLCA